VLRFDHHRRPSRDYLSRPEQWRLLLLVCSFGFVLLLIHEARRPGNWRWFWTDGGAMNVVVHRQSLDPSGYFPGVVPGYLSSIKDHTVFRAAERDAWFHLIDVLESRGADELEAASIHNDMGFVPLFEQPEHYRGKLVTVRGEARRVLYRQAPKNDQGVQGYHQVVLRPAGGPDSPIIIYCLHLPHGFPVGENIREPVSVTGFFFKNWAYPTEAAIHSFPTLLARTMQWTRPVEVESRPLQGADFVAMVVISAAVGLSLAWWLVRRK
jgi:hypothetical protein